MLKSLLATTALIALGTAALAQVTAEGLVARYQAEGHDRIEVAVGPTQIEVGTIRDGIKTETVYDRATGAVLERETGPAGTYRIDRGVEIETSPEDFVELRSGGVVTGGVGAVDPLVNRIVAELQAAGHDRIEVAVGPTQIEVGTIRDGIKTETVYDRATGAVLERETGPAGTYRIDRGVEIETSDEDFVGGVGDDDRILADATETNDRGQHDRDQDARDDQHDRDQDARDAQHDRDQDARDDQNDRDQDSRDDN